MRWFLSIFFCLPLILFFIWKGTSFLIFPRLIHFGKVSRGKCETFSKLSAIKYRYRDFSFASIFVVFIRYDLISFLGRNFKFVIAIGRFFFSFFFTDCFIWCLTMRCIIKYLDIIYGYLYGGVLGCVMKVTCFPSTKWTRVRTHEGARIRPGFITEMLLYTYYCENGEKRQQKAGRRQLSEYVFEAFTVN